MSVSAAAASPLSPVVDYAPTKSLTPDAKAKLEEWGLGPIEAMTEKDVQATPIKALRVYIAAHKPKIAGVRAPKRREDYDAFFRIWFAYIRTQLQNASAQPLLSQAMLQTATATNYINLPNNQQMGMIAGCHGTPSSKPESHNSQASPLQHMPSETSPTVFVAPASLAQKTRSEGGSQRSRETRKRLRVEGPSGVEQERDVRPKLSPHAASMMMPEGKQQERVANATQAFLATYSRPEPFPQRTQINGNPLAAGPPTAVDFPSSADQLAEIDQMLTIDGSIPATMSRCTGIPPLTPENAPLVLQKIGEKAPSSVCDPELLVVLAEIGFFTHSSKASGDTSAELQTESVNYLTSSELTGSSAQLHDAENVVEYCEEVAQAALQHAQANGADPDNLQVQQMVADVPLLSGGACHLLMGGDRSGVQDDVQRS